jgi:organic radical activating enzyme
MNLRVKEIFYSLQGEGGRQGEASIFIRLAGCNLQCPFCDTDFAGGQPMTADEILAAIASFPCRWIIWTGGEPALQLTSAIIRFFNGKGYLQAIESNGCFPLPEGLAYSTISPKPASSFQKNHLMEIGDYATINPEVDEIRLPVRDGDFLPDIKILPVSKKYFVSPIFEKNDIETKQNIDRCIDLVKKNPQWQLSVQMHKLIGIE